MDAVEIDTVLVPVDASDQAVTAIEYAVAIARRYDASVHCLFVLSQELVEAIEDDAVESDAVAADHETVMDAAAEIAGDVPVCHSSAHGFSPSRLTVHPGSVILDAADDVAADFLVVPREPLNGDPGEVLGKAAEYVLMYASQPVLSV
ncbi:universal stress protein UspA [Halobacteriales archaeon QS_1_68_17]|nr:MAG: universal stress protein UspA [Halobacteriales archaeon QS_1_68_17]